MIDKNKYEPAISQYNGHDFVSIYELDANGVRFPKAVISLGKKKLMILEAFFPDLKSLLGITDGGPPRNRTTREPTSQFREEAYKEKELSEDDIPF